MKSKPEYTGEIAAGHASLLDALKQLAEGIIEARATVKKAEALKRPIVGPEAMDLHNMEYLCERLIGDITLYFEEILGEDYTIE